MKFSAVIATAAAVASVSAEGYYSYVNTTSVAPVQSYTTVVSEYTTVCPYATTFTYGSSTYAVTGPTTLT